MFHAVDCTEHYQRVRKLMAHIPGQDTPSSLTVPDERTRVLRATLLLEECIETIEALGVRVCAVTSEGPLIPIAGEGRCDFDFSCDGLCDIVGVADGCADVSVIATGTLVACGIPDKALLEAVDENNLAKFGPGSYVRADGKLVKPPGHKPPDIAKIIGYEECDDGR